MNILAKLLFKLMPLFLMITPAYSEEKYAIYGGIGYLDKKTSPCLSEIYDSGSKNYQNIRDKINKSITAKLKSTKIKAGTFNLITGSNDLGAALKKEGIDFKARPSQTQIKEFLEDVNERLYTIAIVGSLEFHQQWKTQSTIPLFQDFFTVNVSALLVQAGGDNPGSISLAGMGSVVGNIQDAENFVGFKNLCRENTTISGKLQNILGKMYIRAAEKSIDNMAGVKKLAKDDKDTLIVTGVGVESKAIRKFFQMNTQEKKPKSICQIKIPCDRKDQTCNSIIALTAFKTTEAFSSAGHLAIPPLNWKAWGKTAQYQSSKNVKLTGGRREISDTIEINVGVDSADRKIVAKLTGIAEKDIKNLGKSKHIGARVYMGWMQADWYETEYDACNIVEDKGTYGEAEGKPIIDKRSSKLYGVNPPVDNRAGGYVTAIMNAITAFEDKLNAKK